MPDLPTDPSVRAALAAHAARLNHDLGKHVALNQRWLGADPSTEALYDALRADLLATRRGPDGAQDAATVWAGLRPELVGERPLAGQHITLAGRPSFDALDQVMAELASVVARLAAGESLDEAALRDAHNAARAATDRCRALAFELVAWHRGTDG